MSNKQLGNLGEQEVCDLVKCPNCQNKLILLPPGFPMYDIQCSKCTFRVQVKTVNSRPKSQIFGAGWDIYDKVLKAGYLAPPLMVNFRWTDKKGFHREIKFYPFVAKGNIKKYILSATAKRANYPMFKYIKLDRIPHFVLYQIFDPLKRENL